MKQTPQKVTPETCLAWLRAAYIEDQAQGYCVPSNYNGIPGKSMMSTVANNLEVTKRDENEYGDNHTHWANPVAMPDEGMAAILYDAYVEYRNQCQENTRKKAAKANGEDFTLQPESPVKTTSGVTLDYLERIEAKLDAVLEAVASE